MDPCELRLAKGDASVRDLVARREPMIAFALRSVLSHYNLDTAEGRVGALREAAPLVAKIKDRALRPEYARKLAGDLGMEIETVAKAVGNVASAGQVGPPVPSARKHPDVPAQDAPLTLVEREALKLAIQSPALAGPMFDAITPADYAYPLHVVIRQAIADVGGLSGATGGAVWVEKVREACGDLTAAALVGELAVEPLRIDGEADPRYVAVTLARLQLASVMRRLNDVKSRVQRINPVTQRDEYLALAGELFSLEQHARALREQAVGGL
jgi:DNA primase